MKIIGICKPFSPTFNFMVYDDDNGLVSDFPCTFDGLSELAIEIAKQNNVTKIALVGPKNYTQKIKENIKGVEVTKYDQNILEIDLI